jgi:hypothetical protein
MSNVIAVNRSRFWFGLGLVVILMAAFLLQVRYLLWGDWTYDQGFYFVVARLMSQGFTPYSEIHMSEQPLMVLSTYWPYRIFDSIWGMQLLMVLYAMVAWRPSWQLATA